jgi:hypothetical protein
MAEKGQNPSYVDSLLDYDRPDVILAHGERPILVLERTEEVPTGHNVGQRFARIVRAAELKVPLVYFFPFVAQKHGQETQQREAEEKTNQRYVNARLFDALSRLEKIHNTLSVPVNWPVDSHFELLRTSEKDAEVQRVVSGVIDGMTKNLTLDDIRKDVAIKTAYEESYREKETRLKSQNRYSNPPPSVVIMDSVALGSALKLDGKGIARLAARNESVLYNIGMNYIRSDPYTGMLLFYDYLYTRTGVSPKHRSRNLVVKMPQISLSEWTHESSISANRKDIFLYSHFSDAIALKDGIVW